jgi:hypothetical protein
MPMLVMAAPCAIIEQAVRIQRRRYAGDTRAHKHGTAAGLRLQVAGLLHHARRLEATVWRA